MMDNLDCITVLVLIHEDILEDLCQAVFDDGILLQQVACTQQDVIEVQSIALPQDPLILRPCQGVSHLTFEASNIVCEFLGIRRRK
jgi:hypothetical protein